MGNIGRDGRGDVGMADAQGKASEDYGTARVRSREGERYILSELMAPSE